MLWLRRTRTRAAYGAALLLAASLGAGCSDDPSGAREENAIIVSGKVTESGTGRAIANARVSVPTAPSIDPQWTGTDGLYRFTDLPATKNRLRVECYGYEPYEADVPPPIINGAATLNPALVKKSYNVPTVKPLSTGPVRVRDRVLEADFDRDGSYTPFRVKGAAFSPSVIGSNWGVTPRVYDRSIEFLTNLHANTVRTYSGADPYFLGKAAQAGIRVIVGFWIPLDLDLTDSLNRASVKADFMRMVTELKGYDAVLIWNLGNEQNYGNGTGRPWFSLVQELAILAYQIEGPTYHPVCASNGGFVNIGDPTKGADDASLSYMDLWGSNDYEIDFTASFSSFRTRTSKPIVLTEWGIDALDNRTKAEYEDVQARFDSTNWAQILANADVCVGGTVFEFTDEWWKAGSPSTHDYGGYAYWSHPDGYSNEEWWGLIAVTPDANGDGLDDWRPRKAFVALQRLWM